MVADFLAGLVAGTGLGILVDPRLRAYVADYEWRRGPTLARLTTEMLKRLREDEIDESDEETSQLR